MMNRNWFLPHQLTGRWTRATFFSLQGERAFLCRESTVVGKGDGCSVDCAFFSSGGGIIYQC